MMRAHPLAEVKLQNDDDRRHQTRVALRMPITRARRWSTGAWRELSAEIVDLSSRGVGLRLNQEVHLGDRLSLALPLGDGLADLRVTVEVRHVRADSRAGEWRAGGLFRALAAADHARIMRFVFDELRDSDRL
jgi:c-di-GMP-binding flagellar brake protein YcgR